MIQGIVMKTGEVFLSSNIEKIVPEDYNNPDLEVTQPYVLEKIPLTGSINIKPYLEGFTSQTVFSFRTDDVLTLFSPEENIIEEYKKQTGVVEQLELNVEE